MNNSKIFYYYSTVGATLSCCKGTGKLCLALGTLENILSEIMPQAIKCLLGATG